jgi:hypothetical protein
MVGWLEIIYLAQVGVATKVAPHSRIPLQTGQALSFLPHTHLQLQGASILCKLCMVAELVGEGSNFLFVQFSIVDA